MSGPSAIPVVRWTRSLETPQDTEALAGTVARALGPGDVVLMEGDLGAGKTVFVRAAISALAGEPVEVPSPTFTLVQSYEVDQPKGPSTGPSPGRLDVHHFDLYRIEDADEVIELGWDEALTGLVFVEWPDRLMHLRPAQFLEVRLRLRPEARGRDGMITAHGADLAERLRRVLAQGRVLDEDEREGL